MEPSNWQYSSIAAALAALASVLYYLNRNIYTYWERKGVSGPKPWPVVGNFISLLFKDRLKLDMEWRNKYGQVYGLYQGRNPFLVIADPEVMMQICVKDFDLIPNHVQNEFNNKYMSNFLFNLRDDKWRQVRTMLTPTFTSGKIKRMFKLLDACADDLTELFGEQLVECKESLVNVKETYSMFTMDAITSCCYGIKLQRAGTINLKTAATRDDFVAMAMKIFEIDWLGLFTLLAVPRKVLRYFNYRFGRSHVLKPFANKTKQLIAARRGSAKKFEDYLQLLVDARIGDELETNETDHAEDHHAGLNSEQFIEDQQKMVEQIRNNSNDSNNNKSNQAFKLDDLDILANSMILLAVGLETTGTLLAHCSYLLAFHQDIQEKLYQEVLKIVEFKVVEGDSSRKVAAFDYDSLTYCKYLDAVLSETMRILPPVSHMDRQTNVDYRLEKYGIDLPAGSRMVLAYHTLMNDPENWEHPEKFDPERFFPENKEKIVPGTYLPFGLGPRHCIGMRFSLTEAKLALSKVLIKYKFLPAPDTVFPPKPKKPVFVLHSITKPLVRVVPR